MIPRKAPLLGVFTNGRLAGRNVDTVDLVAGYLALTFEFLVVLCRTRRSACIQDSTA
jgi:hypothetical protein